MGRAFVNTASDFHNAVIPPAEAVARFVDTASGAQYAVMSLAEVVAHFACMAYGAHNAATQNAMGVVRFVHTIYNAGGAEFAAKGLHFAYIKDEKIAVQSVILLPTRLIERAS